MEAEATTSPEQTSSEQTSDIAAENVVNDVAPAMTTDEVTIVDSPATYADGKYQSVGELEKGYTELQSTFSKKMGAFKGAPEAYEFNEGYVAEDNQGLADVLTGWGAENQLSNEGLNSLVDNYNKYQYEQNEAQMESEFKKLGDNGSERIKTAREFLEANLGVEATQGLAKSMNSAASIEAIEKLIGMSKSPTVAPSQPAQFADKAKVEAMRYEVDDNGNRKMENPQYREHVLKLEAALLNR